VRHFFSQAHFSENWGLLSLSPVIGGNIFSLVFGRNLDAHSRAVPTAPISQSTSQCMQGVQCYMTSLYMTVWACFLASVLAAWAGWRDRKNHIIMKTNVPEVVWDQDN
jgi:hypothetical protein